MQGRREEAFHVRGAEAVQPPVTLTEHEGIVGPALGVVRNRVGVPRQHESVFSFPELRDQIGLAGPTGERLDPHVEAEPSRPLGQ